ncbi:GNAT family N-acetyltransferase [Clostridiaceae bacterium UIB06]|uniref:GNAT family N-acetyltransferase n=1 Tax=Clostridium thailandense TaxID=2794346 RepID=A0A949TXS5_9CLOT|nr:GNAT family N-acetyltransferase [Clostridium thailandense]MBV7272444.1 GNAT family N-acetyltransferase [Clostridium thailandense]MCH5136968.1 GNAT family N-acetyltransferase [Clostridiaceae bacterium UIB06]
MYGESAIKPWRIDFFTSEDAQGVVDLYRAIYGDDYPRKEVYDTKELVRQSNAGETYRMVARTEDGEVVGQAALYQSSPPNKRLYEYGQLMVRHDYRKSWIAMKLIGESLKKIPQRYGLEQVWGEAVCNHLFTQQSAVRHGGYETGLEVDLIPAESYSQANSQAANGRVSTLVVFYNFKNKLQTIYLPKVYEEILKEIYEAADCGHCFVTSEGVLPGEISTVGELQIFNNAGVARITIDEIGSDFEVYLNNLEVKTKAAGIVVTQVFMRLTRPCTGAAVDILRKRGYFFGGALPRWFDDDGFFMQKIVGLPNFQGVKLYSKRSKKIMEFIKNDWQEVRGDL